MNLIQVKVTPTPNGNRCDGIDLARVANKLDEIKKVSLTNAINTLEEEIKLMEKSSHITEGLLGDKDGNPSTYLKVITSNKPKD